MHYISPHDRSTKISKLNSFDIHHRKSETRKENHLVFVFALKRHAVGAEISLADRSLWQLRRRRELPIAIDTVSMKSTPRRDGWIASSLLPWSLAPQAYTAATQRQLFSDKLQDIFVVEIKTKQSITSFYFLWSKLAKLTLLVTPW